MRELDIDRIAPTRRPEGKADSYQVWEDLLFVHWEVEASALRRVVPDGLDIDTFDGKAYVGVVPFMMRDVRPRLVPKALAFNFLETNLRTYVHVGGKDPGVFFFSLEAESRIAVQAARTIWGLPYFHATMSMHKEDNEVSYRTERSSGSNPVHSARYEITDYIGESKPGTLEFFLFERYLLHVERSGTLYTGQVHHVPYPVHNARVDEIEDGLIAAAGLPPAQGFPALSHYSKGVEVEIFNLWPR